MNTKKILLPVLLIVALSFFISCDSDNSIDQQADQILEDGLDQVDIVDYSDQVLMDFMEDDMSDANIICEHSSVVGSSELKVMTYISQDRMRLEYTLTPPVEGQGDLYIVTDGEYMYMWGNSFLGGITSGFKIAIGGDDSTDLSSTDMAEFVDFDMPMTGCTVWEADDSLFEIPSDIDFGGNMFGLDCSICDQMPASEKPACLEAMGCEEEE